MTKPDADDIYSKIKKRFKDTLDYWREDTTDEDLKDFAKHDLRQMLENYGSLKLYKYMNISYHSIRNVKKQLLYLSPNGSFNDFYEGLPRITGENIDYRNIESLSKMARIACFSENYDNALLWSHYADGSRGICVEYDLSLLADDQYHVLEHLCPVFYTQKRHFKRDISSLIESNKILEEAIKNGNTYDDYESLDDIVPLFVYKGEEWSYEREWRIIYTKKEQYDLNDNQLYNGVIPFSCITGMYMGYRIDPEVKQDIEDICQELRKRTGREIPLYEETISRETYEISFARKP